MFTVELIQGWDEDLAALWYDAMDDASLREWETQAASLGAHFFPPVMERGVCPCGAALYDMERFQATLNSLVIS